MVKRFLLADDNEIARRLLSELIASRAEWLFARQGPTVSKQSRWLQMPRLNGIDAGRQITALLPGIPVLIISSHDSDLVISEIKSTQIRGFVSKDTLPSELFLAIDTILAGGAYFPSSKQRDDGGDAKPRGGEAGN